jgi:hypothetical protein
VRALNIQEMKAVSAGQASLYDAVDILSTLTGTFLANNLTVAGLVWADSGIRAASFIGAPLFAATYVVGGFIGYQVGQYLKS